MWANVVYCWMFVIALACGGLLARSSASAQDAKSVMSDKKQSSYGEESKDLKYEDKKFDVPYWDRSESFQIRATIALVGEGNPLGALGARMAVSESVPTVKGWEFYFDKVLPINRTFLDVIRDGRPLPDMRAKEIRDLRVPDQGLYLAYLQALRRSHAATPEMFQNSASTFRNATYTHLAANPKLYRGEIITVQGVLASINTLAAPPLLNDEVLTIYEGWIVGPTKGAPPFAIVFTQMPNDLKINAEVTFQGYFLSNILIPADKERGMKKDLICPWLIGKTLTVAEDGPASKMPILESGDSYEVVIYVFGTILGIAALIGLLNLYFRRTDQKTQSKLAELRDRSQPFKLDEGTPEEKRGPDEASPDGDWPGRIGK